MIDPREDQKNYQRALAWVGEQITAAERQGLTLDYLGGWHTFKPDRKALARAWRVLYNVPDSMIDLFTGPQERWGQAVLRWLRHHPDQDGGKDSG
jgi:hypothetical protein